MKYDKLQESLGLEEYKKRIEKLEFILENANEGLFYMEKNYFGRLFNKDFYKNFGIKTENVNFSDWLGLVHPDDENEYRKYIEEQIENKTKTYEIQYRVKNKFSQFIWIKSKGKVIYDNKKDIFYIVGSHTNITERKLNEEKTIYLAYHDEITGLYNENKIKEILKFEASSQNIGYVVYIDTSNYRTINDMLNFQIGNGILKITAERIEKSLPSKSYLARIFGSEFCAIIKKENVESIELLMEKLLKRIKQSIKIDCRTIYLDARISVIAYPKDGFQSNDIIFNSQIMISMMKNDNILGICYFDEKLKKVYLRKLGIERCLSEAMNKNEMYINYQPIIELETGLIHGFEALIRWKNQELGQIHPDEFIQIAEKNSFINEIGDFVLFEACKFGKKLNDLNICVHISINVSVIQLYQKDYVSKVLDTIENTGIDKNLLYLEVTESVAFDSNPEVIDRLISLNEHGIKLSIDDFGKGYSSMNSVISLPIAQLKIDKSLINQINSCKDTVGLLELMVLHGKNTGFNVLAEGIEDGGIANKVNGINIDYGQGYHFFKPMQSENVFTLVQQKNECFKQSYSIN